MKAVSTCGFYPAKPRFSSPIGFGLTCLLFIVPAAFSQTASRNIEPTNPSEVVEEVGSLAAQPLVVRAMDLLLADNHKNLEQLIELTEIPAPPFAEQARALRYQEMLRETGLTKVSIDKVGNVIGFRPGVVGHRTVAVVAHLDTVFPAQTDVTVKRDGNVFRAPGVGDNSRGLVALLSVIRALETAGLTTKDHVMFVGSVGEEGLGDLRGVRHLFTPGETVIDALIAIDGGRNNRLVHRAVGSLRYRVIVSGAGGHSWGAFGLANPHHATGRMIGQFLELASPITINGPKASFNIGRIGGGTSINSITAQSWFEVDMRSTNAEKLSALDEALKQATHTGLTEENRTRREGPELTLELRSVGRRPAGATATTEPLVMRAVAAMKQLGLQPRLTASSTDANIPMSIGVPAITLSRGGRTRNAHSPDESWENIDSHLSLQLTLLTLLAEAGFVAPKR